MGVCVELNETIFYPQGGGQPSDTGKLEAAGLPPLDVVFVSNDIERMGVIRHEVEGDVAQWEAAISACKPVRVICKVDEAKRRDHARLHSAGHLLDVALRDLGFKCKPLRG